MSQNFASADFHFVWNGDGTFAVAFSGKQKGVNISFTFTYTDPAGLTSNPCQVTIRTKS